MCDVMRAEVRLKLRCWKCLALKKLKQTLRPNFVRGLYLFFAITWSEMMSANSSEGRYTIIVEHLDPELEAWQTLEYQCIASECAASDTKFILSGLTSVSSIAERLSLPLENLTEQSVETLYEGEQRKRVCLLDPKAEKDLAPEDGEEFDVFLFGGILGDEPPRGEYLSLYENVRVMRG
jgi:hypothetical protein